MNDKHEYYIYSLPSVLSHELVNVYNEYVELKEMGELGKLYWTPILRTIKNKFPEDMLIGFPFFGETGEVCGRRVEPVDGVLNVGECVVVFSDIELDRVSFKGVVGVLVRNGDVVDLIVDRGGLLYSLRSYMEYLWEYKSRLERSLRDYDRVRGVIHGHGMGWVDEEIRDGKIGLVRVYDDGSVVIERGDSEAVFSFVGEHDYVLRGVRLKTNIE